MQEREGAWKCKIINCSFQVAHVAASELGNQGSAWSGYTCGSESSNYWLTMEQNLALIAKNKAQSSCSFFKPLLGLPQPGVRTSAWVTDKTRSSHTRRARGLIQTRLFLNLALCEPSANIQHPMAGATPGSHQVEMAPAKRIFSPWGGQVGSWGAEKWRTGWRKGSLINTLKSMPGGQQMGISLAIKLRKATFFKQQSHLFPCTIPSVPIPRPCQNKLKCYKDSWLKEQAPKYLWMLPL